MSFHNFFGSEGKMSIVGPRPPLQTEYESFSEFEKKKLSIK